MKKLLVLFVSLGALVAISGCDSCMFSCKKDTSAQTKSSCCDCEDTLHDVSSAHKGEEVSGEKNASENDKNEVDAAAV